MASAQLAEEELQQSVVVSEEDMDAEVTSADFVEGHHGSQVAASLNKPDNFNLSQDDAASSGADAGDIEMTSAAEKTEHLDEEDAEGELDDVDCFGADTYNCASNGNINGHTSSRRQSEGGSLEESEDEEDDDGGEGVGAVKIKPGETDEEDDDDDDQLRPESDRYSTSNSIVSNESDGDTDWGDAQEGYDEEEQESEAAAPNVCLFCKQDEEKDPGEEFEEFLACSGCGESSHQYCAREAGALREQQDDAKWNCPECGSVSEDQEIDGVEPSVDEKGQSVRTDSQPEPNLLAVDGNSPSDGSRLLRKRKTSPVDTDDTVMALRKRRRRSPEEQGMSSLEAEPHSGQSDGAENENPRKLRLRVSRNQAAVTTTRGPRSMKVTIRVSPASLQEILSRKKGNFNRKRTSRADGRSARPVPVALAPPPMASMSQPFYSFLDRETEEMRAKPYGGILNDNDADTTKTLPTNDDRKRFDEAKQTAEEEWKCMHAVELNAEAPEKSKKSKRSAGPASQIECIEFGGWEIDTWYAAPYPEEYSRNRILYICEFCLKYMNSDYVAWRHKLKCSAKYPPGDEIYRHGSVSVFEVDGRKNPVYCQNLCLLAKLFLGSKTLYYDVEPFLFYVLCEYDDLGYHFVGYFSKEKRASSQNNVSCILTLPIHQRKGYGNLLIDFSYLLTRAEQKTGSPEKPLSDMGLVSYRNYWRLVMCQYLLGRWDSTQDAGVTSGLSIRQISVDTGLTPDDVISALEGLRCLARDGSTGLYAFRVDMTYCREYLAKWDAKNYVQLDPKALAWTPYVMGRGNATNFELGPAITAIAPREEDEDRKVSNAANALGDAAAKPNVPASERVPSLDSGDVVDKAATETGEAGLADGAGQLEQQIRLSTEPHDSVGQGPGSGDERAGSGTPQQENNEQKHWTGAYEDIPASRFEVVPPPGGRRADRPRGVMPRPTVLRTASNNARPRRSAGVSVGRTPAASRLKTSGSSRRKTGGTGRGPGRWPKGTKKSDYGNASSGPGLPPSWVTDMVSTLKTPKEAGKSGVGTSQAMDTVRVQFTESVAVGGGADGPAAAPGQEASSV